MKTEPLKMEKFNWFCGVNASDNLDGFQWDPEHTVYNACYSNFVDTIPHILFLVFGSLVLFALYCCHKWENHSYLLKYPGHDTRWVLNYFFLIFLILQFLEGILTDLILKEGQATEPHLYVPSCLALLAGLLAVIYNHHMEYWDLPHMSWLLEIYWFLALATSSVKLVNMVNDEMVDNDQMRYNLTIVAAILYALYWILEINVIRTKVFGWFYEEQIFPKDLTKENMRFLQGYTNLLSTAIFWWMNWLFRLGYTRALELEDLGSLSTVQTTKYNRDKFEEAVAIEVKRAKETYKELNLYRVYLRTYGKRLVGAGTLKFVADTTALITPFVIFGIISYATQLQEDEAVTDRTVKYISSNDFVRNGIILVFLLFLLSYTRSICVQSHFHIVITEAGHAKAAIQAAVYDKALRISTYTISGGSMTTGQITNHMSVDAMNILTSFQYIHSSWSIPFQLLGYLAILYYQLGPSALIGFCVFVIILPLQTILAKKLTTLQKQSMVHSDSRLKLTNEMLQGMKLIKLYAWEEIFLNVIGEARGQEILMQFRSTGWRVLMFTLAGSAPLMVTLVSYGLYQVLEGKALTPEITFASLSVFNNMLVLMFMIPQVFQFYVNAIVSTKRLRQFFSATEIEDAEDGRTLERVNRLSVNDHQISSVVTAASHSIESYKKIEGESSNVFPNPSFESKMKGDLKESNLKFAEETVDKLKYDTGYPAVKVSDGNFSWDVDTDEPLLSDLNVEIPTGKLTMIVGQVGSGKSSLISALLGEMTTLTGTVQWDSKVGQVAYGAQKPWLLNATLQDNVTFGNKMDPARYKACIDACSLQPDIEILPAGDQTEIGEKGINLSGGQKQRVSVARAIYSPHSVVILDDPLSALDVHVGAHLFEEGIQGVLLKENRTVVLVTHQVQYLDQADKILVIKDGKIQHQGSYESICDENPQFAENCQKLMQEKAEESDTESLDNVSIDEERKELISTKSNEEKKSKLNKEKGALIEEEERNKGSVSWRVYWHYINTFNALLFLLCVSLFVVHNALLVMNNYWLSLWSEAGADAEEDELDDILKKYLPVYGGLTAASVLMSNLSTAVMLLASLRAAKIIHNAMLSCVIHAPLRFFDTTPVGRILNRFSSDTQVIDQKLSMSLVFSIRITIECTVAILVNAFKLAMTLDFFLRISVSCLAAIIVNTLVSWVFIIAIIPMFVLYLYIMKFFVTTSRELQRLESISRSPVFAHFSETLGGLPTIRAYNVQEQFAKDILNKIEKSNITFLYLQTSNRWLGTRLDFIGSFIVFVAGMVSLGSAFAGGVAPSLVGLSITYALSISDSLNWVIRQAADVEMQMNAIERTSHYTNLDSEPYQGSRTPPASWPDKGEITLDGVHARYAKTLDPVLHGVTVTLAPTEKIGICGRTGSGKSSLTLCLFRVIDMFKGHILIDGEDISKLSLTTLRKHLSIIPQDPVLFNGSIRFNLDPFEERTDDDLWHALEISQLKGVVSDLESGLDSPVTEGGENFSVGQRQLFCLARAFLRKSKVLIMDEATASIDMETDAIVQNIVRTAFADCTVITIAHRVSTILDSNKIITLDNGRMVEFDEPEKLLEQEDSIFASLVNSNQ